STTLEAGIKGVSPFGERDWVQSLSYSVAVYRITIENEIVPFDGGSWYFSAGRSRRLGLEVGSDLEFRYGIGLKVALTLLDARYLEYTNDLGDFAGKSVPGIAPVVVNGRLRYRSSWGFSAEAGLEYVGEYVADDAGTATVPAYTLVGGALSYSVSWSEVVASLHIGVQNLLDEHYAASAYINPSTRTNASGNPVPVYLEPGLPRNFFGGFAVVLQL
ncbi:MAG: TonB-dependent receptor, partial [Proteobacteria bacterium]|nr:TonB-dependent receptor [Pseudomonadota bacterium]